LKSLLSDGTVRDMTDVPDELLNNLQQRVKKQTIDNEPFFDPEGAKNALAECSLPLHALDFETIAFPVPVWPGTRPYEAVPFQYSFHSVTELGTLEHKEYIDLTGEDPARGVAEALIRDCTGFGRILMYTAFERTQLRALAGRFPDLATQLEAIADRLFDLRPVAQRFFYHPSQEGSWSIKKILPAIAEQGYDDLDVAGGQAAMDAYAEATSSETSPDRAAEVRRQLLEYCALDTKGLLLVWRSLAGRTDVTL